MGVGIICFFVDDMSIFAETRVENNKWVILGGEEEASTYSLTIDIYCKKNQDNKKINKPIRQSIFLFAYFLLVFCLVILLTQPRKRLTTMSDDGADNDITLADIDVDDKTKYRILHKDFYNS